MTDRHDQTIWVGRIDGEWYYVHRMAKMPNGMSVAVQTQESQRPILRVLTVGDPRRDRAICRALQETYGRLEDIYELTGMGD